MPAATLTGLEKFTCCHPLAVSLVKVAVASSVPERSRDRRHGYRCLPNLYKTGCRVIKPDVAAVNLTPTSIAFGSFAIGASCWG